MSTPIRIIGVAKGYKFYARPADRLRELIRRKPMHRIHWALRDVDFNVEQGETFGVIGENGAGKSTLLKLVAGTTKPTAGRVEVAGRVAALLELGIGFHPEENGRENVYLLGALNGIGPRRMAQYYAAIAEFSELSEEVLQRPVKTYSSGMFIRLAFAAATAVEPDVLIVDEALSVGDMYFQKKSLDRIMGFRERGKTVLFCGHNMYQVRSLCSRAVWLHEGKVRALGATEAVVTAYENYEREKEAQLKSHEPAVTAYHPPLTSTAPVRIVEVKIEGASGDPPLFETFRPARVAVEVDGAQAMTPYHVGIAIVRNDKTNVFGTSTHFGARAEPLRGQGRRRVRLDFPELHLLSGEYRLSVYVLDDSGIQTYDMAELVCPFIVHNPRREFGMMYMPYRWALD